MDKYKGRAYNEQAVFWKAAFLLYRKFRFFTVAKKCMSIEHTLDKEGE